MKKKEKEGKRAKVVVVGLDAAGKTSILNYYKGLEFATATHPTLGANVEELNFRDLIMIATDIGGQQGFRGIWKNFFQGTELIIFVVDSADITRIPEAKNELYERVLSDKNLKGVPLIVYLNKQDLEGGLTETEAITTLGIHEIQDRSFHIVGTSAVSGRGLAQGFQWVYETLTGKKLERDITLHEIYVFSKGGVTLVHLSDGSEKADPLMVTGLLSAIQTMGQEVFSETMESLKTQNLKIVFAATEELAGALVVSINDNETIVRKVLYEVLDTVAEEGAEKAKSELRELIQTWGIHVPTSK